MIDKNDEPGRDAEPLEAPPTGYGHPAHRPDPNARYGFDPGPPRTLPRDAEKRWRVPG
jgi:hypothetical protein